jgi:hypothetical protein
MAQSGLGIAEGFFGRKYTWNFCPIGLPRDRTPMGQTASFARRSRWKLGITQSLAF